MKAIRRPVAEAARFSCHRGRQGSRDRAYDLARRIRFRDHRAARRTGRDARTAVGDRARPHSRSGPGGNAGSYQGARSPRRVRSARRAGARGCFGHRLRAEESRCGLPRPAEEVPGPSREGTQVPLAPPALGSLHVTLFVFDLGLVLEAAREHGPSAQEHGVVDALYGKGRAATLFAPNGLRVELMERR